MGSDGKITGNFLTKSSNCLPSLIGAKAVNMTPSWRLGFAKKAIATSVPNQSGISLAIAYCDEDKKLSKLLMANTGFDGSPEDEAKVCQESGLALNTNKPSASAGICFATFREPCAKDLLALAASVGLTFTVNLMALALPWLTEDAP